MNVLWGKGQKRMLSMYCRTQQLSWHFLAQGYGLQQIIFCMHLDL